MNFEILGEITEIETIAIGAAIRDLPRLKKLCGKGRWRKMKGIALVVGRAGAYAKPSCTGTKRTESVRWSSSESGILIEDTVTKTSEAKRAFAVCVRNAGYEASLELHKIYTVLPHAEAEKESDIRVIDESGEDYLFPSDWFVPIDVPDEVEASLLEAS